MSETLITCENVGKKFCRDFKKSLWYGLKDSATDLLGRKQAVLKKASTPPVLASIELRPGEFWANKDITFEVKRGECLGLLGRNGAGKTTLLKMLSGLIKPDCGRIKIRGRVGALIALGAGFNPVLTGRENIYINAMVLGLSKKVINDRVDEIVDFAEIGAFIDSPVRTYSSGMQVRLGFAVSTALEPDVLILDEVLAVGDGAFRAKCYTRIGKLMRDSAVILVSHDLNSVGQMCTLGIALSSGQMSGSGVAPISDVLQDYNRQLEATTGKSATSWNVFKSDPLEEGYLRLASTNIKSGGFLEIEFECVLSADVQHCVLRATIFSLSGEAVVEWNSKAQNATVCLASGRNMISLRIGPIQLKAGSYDFTLLLADSTGFNMLFLWHRGVRISVDGSPFGQAACQVGGSIGITQP